jgi:hypothetical protein
VFENSCGFKFAALRGGERGGEFEGGCRCGFGKQVGAENHDFEIRLDAKHAEEDAKETECGGQASSLSWKTGFQPVPRQREANELKRRGAKHAEKDAEGKILS